MPVDKKPDMPVYKGKILPVNYDEIEGKDVIAFAGIASPEKFYNSLISLDVNIIKKFSFADHHQFSKREINKLIKIAKKHKAKLVTTEKDYVRISNKQKEQIEYLEIDIDLPKNFYDEIIFSNLDLAT